MSQYAMRKERMDLRKADIERAASSERGAESFRSKGDKNSKKLQSLPCFNFK